MHSESVINRRDFIKLVGSGIIVTFSIDKVLSNPLVPVLEDQLSSWIHIGGNGYITVFTGKAEVGQNIRTSLSQIVAEELNTDISKIVMVMGDTDLTPYDRGTFGSRSIPYMGPPLRKAAATAREVLIDMASKAWKCNRDNLYVENASVKERDGIRTIDFAQLTKGEAFVKPVDDKVKTKPVDQWRIAGTSVPKVNGASFVTGRHQYTSDMKLDGMMYGKVLRAPAYGAKLISADVSKARSMPGVKVVKDGDFIAVAAPTQRDATIALKSIDAQWDLTPQPSRSEIFQYIRKNSRSGDASVKGSVDKLYAQSDIKLEQNYNINYIAHVPLEPRAGLAKWEGDKLRYGLALNDPSVSRKISQMYSTFRKRRSGSFNPIPARVMVESIRVKPVSKLRAFRRTLEAP